MHFEGYILWEMSVRREKRRPPQFELIAGDAVCLDFINTLDNRSSDAPKELLTSFTELARFAEDTKILSPSEVNELVERSQRKGVLADAASDGVLGVRHAQVQPEPNAPSAGTVCAARGSATSRGYDDFASLSRSIDQFATGL